MAGRQDGEICRDGIKTDNKVQLWLLYLQYNKSCTEVLILDLDIRCQPTGDV